MPKDMTKATEQAKPQAKPRAKAAAKAAAAKAPAKQAKKANAKARSAMPRQASKTVAKARISDNAKTIGNAKTTVNAKTTDQAKTKAKAAVPARPVAAAPASEPVLIGAAMRSFQASVPAALAMNTTLADMAHANMTAGLELARDLAGAKTPMDAMRLGVAYWCNQLSAVQAQARALQSLSAVWMKPGGDRSRAV